MKMEEPRKRPLKRQDSIGGKYKTQERIQERNVSNETKFGLEEDELNKTLIVTNAFPPRRKMFWLVWIKRNLQEKIMQELEGSRRTKDYARTQRITRMKEFARIWKIKKNESFFKNLKDLDERKIMQEFEGSEEWKINQEKFMSTRTQDLNLATKEEEKDEKV